MDRSILRPLCLSAVVLSFCLEPGAVRAQGSPSPAAAPPGEVAQPGSTGGSPTLAAPGPGRHGASQPSGATRELLAEHFAVQLPAHLALSTFEVSALVNAGTQARPVYKARFQAVAELRVPTFQETGRIGPVVWLRPVGRPGEAVRLYGTATATRVEEGPWQVEFGLELNPIPRLGQPRDAFSGEALVRGGEEERRWLDELALPVRERLALELPGHWTVESFTVREGGVRGDQIVVRFAAELALFEPTFVETTRLEDGVVVTKAAEAGTRRTVTGSAALRLVDGRFEPALQLDADPAAALGRPLAAFTGRVIVAGTEEEKAWREERHRRAVEEARRARELEEEKRQAELAAVEHGRRLEAQRAAEREAQRQARLQELAGVLGGQLAAGLPGPWKAGAVELVEVAEREGGVVEAAFAVPVTLVEDGYVEKGREEGVLLLERVAAAGEVRRLRGRVTARRTPQGWSFAIEADNDPITGVGQTLDFFPGKVLVEGSEAEKAWREERHRRAVEEARRARELEEEKRQAELAAQRHRDAQAEAERERRKAAEAALEAELREGLRERFAMGLPGFWKLEGFELREAIAEGEEGRRLAFTASLALQADTFEESRREEGVLLLRAVAKAGEKRQLHGRAAARRTPQGWSFAIEADNNPITGVGQTLDFFPGKVLVEGSEAEKAFREERHRRAVEEARRARELEEEKRQNELAEARHRTALEQERQKFELAKLQFQDRVEQERLARETARRQRDVERRERELAAMRTALQSPDRGTQAMAIDAALRSNDPAMRQMALLEWLKRTARVSLRIEAADEDGRSTMRNGLNAFALDIATVDPTSGAFSGRIVAAARNSPADLAFSGTLTGNALSFASNLCQGNLGLGEDAALRGELRCGGLKNERTSNMEGVFQVSVPLR